MLASCLLCIPHKKTTSKEELDCGAARGRFVTKYWNALPVWRIIRAMWRIFETGNSSAIRMHLDRFLAGDEYLEWRIFRENTVLVVRNMTGMLNCQTKCVQVSDCALVLHPLLSSPSAQSPMWCSSKHSCWARPLTVCPIVELRQQDLTVHSSMLTMASG